MIAYCCNRSSRENNPVFQLFEGVMQMKKRSKKKEYAPGVVLLAAGILMIIMGVLRTEHATVLLKAVNICMECIGIG